MSIKINSFEFENVKRIKAVSLKPTPNGLTVIGGKNGQGKTSVIDAIAWALGGNKMKPDEPNLRGSDKPANLHIELSNGIIVERKGKNGSLTVTDTRGMKGGQQLLDEFISQLALDLPKFIEASDDEKANTLLDTLGIEDKLSVIDEQTKQILEDRKVAGRELKSQKAYADALPYHENVPEQTVSMTDLIAKQRKITEQNTANEHERYEVNALLMHADNLEQDAKDAAREADDLHQQWQDALKKASLAGTESKQARNIYIEAEQRVSKLVDVSTQEVDSEIDNLEHTNAMVNDNKVKHDAEEKLKEYQYKYSVLDDKVVSLRSDREALLKGAKLPLPELAIDDSGKLTYQGHTWNDMSSSEQLKVATAIVKAANPNCGFVLVDKLEQMDSETLIEFGNWAQTEGLQIIGTRVATDDTCTVIIDDGVISGTDND